MQKAKEASTVGILVGTLGAGEREREGGREGGWEGDGVCGHSLSVCVADSLKMIERLKTILKQAGKKVSYNIGWSLPYLLLHVVLYYCCGETECSENGQFHGNRHFCSCGLPREQPRGVSGRLR